MLHVKKTSISFVVFESYDNGQVISDSYMLPENSKETHLLGERIRLLSTTNPVWLLTRLNYRLLITSTDVLHSWAVPAFGVKVDACPGRINETAVSVLRPGTYYGQCSEICGANHGFMPINIKAVDKASMVGFSPFSTNSCNVWFPQVSYAAWMA
jgi:heme/copper-type cytochrome/quinol oxidase subunit 2